MAKWTYFSTGWVDKKKDRNIGGKSNKVLSDHTALKFWSNIFLCDLNFRLLNGNWIIGITFEYSMWQKSAGKSLYPI